MPHTVPCSTRSVQRSYTGRVVDLTAMGKGNYVCVRASDPVVDVVWGEERVPFVISSYPLALPDMFVHTVRCELSFLLQLRFQNLFCIWRHKWKLIPFHYTTTLSFLRFDSALWQSKRCSRIPLTNAGVTIYNWEVPGSVLKDIGDSGFYRSPNIGIGSYDPRANWDKRRRGNRRARRCSVCHRLLYSGTAFLNTKGLHLVWTNFLGCF